MAAHGGDWTPEEMFHFLENPKAWVPGTKMSYAGLGDPQDRANVIAYLNQAGGQPVDLTAGIAPLAEATAAGEAGTAIPDPSLSPGVGPAPGVNPPGEAAEGAPAPAESAGIESMSEAAEVEQAGQAVKPEGAEGVGGATAPAGAAAGAAESSVSEGQNAGGVVTGVTTVDTSEGANAPTSPAAESAEADADQPRGETVLHSPDPSQEAPAQQNTAGEVGLPGQGAAPQSGAPLPGGVSEAPPAPSSTDVPPGTEPPVTQTPVIRREGVQAEQGGVPVGPAQEPVEPQAQGQQGASQQQTPDSAQGEQIAAAPAAPAAGAAAGGGVDFASADVAAGEKLFRRCAACHKLEEGKNAIGPSLWGVVGRPVASIEGFNYSDAMKAHGGQWTPENLLQYLENPKAIVPGTKMAFAGLKDPQDRINVIAYLNEHGGDPQALQQ